MGVDNAAAPLPSSYDPHAYDRWLRTTQPVHFDERTGAWLLSRYEDCLTALRDPRLSAELGQEQRRRHDSLPRSMLNTDPPDHARLRSPAAAVVAPARLATLRTRLEPVVKHFVETAAQRGDFDAVSDYAAPLAVVALATLLGVPAADLRRFARLTRSAAVNLDPLVDEQNAVSGRLAALELSEYLRGLVEERRAAPGDVLDVLVGRALAQDCGSKLSPDDALSTCVLFVVGGYEPLVNLIGNGLHTLSTRLPEAQRLRGDPRLWRRAIDELLRWESPIPFTARVCREDVPVRGRVIPRGSTVVIVLAAANRDPDVFTRPEVVDVGRHPNPMLAFGGGPHLCLAASMTRAVGELALSATLDRFRVVEPGTAPARWRRNLIPHGLECLPLHVVE